MSLQDYNLGRLRAVPPISALTQASRWANEAFRAAGLEADTGEQLTSILRDAGLRVDGAVSVTPAGGADSMIPGYCVDSVRSLAPTLIRLGIATGAELDAFEDRLADELREAGAVLWSPELVGAWARVP